MVVVRGTCCTIIFLVRYVYEGVNNLVDNDYSLLNYWNTDFILSRPNTEKSVCKVFYDFDSTEYMHS